MNIKRIDFISSVAQLGPNIYEKGCATFLHMCFGVFIDYSRMNGKRTDPSASFFDFPHLKIIPPLLHNYHLPLSPSLGLYSHLGLGRFFSFLILHTFGRTPWTGDQFAGRPLPTHTTV
jgi:hypothetical protein